MPTEPSFSIVIETLNLAHEPLELFRRMLESLAAQTLSPHRAREVVVLDTHQAGAEQLRAAVEGIDWLTIVDCQPGLSYDQVKKLGFSRTTGEIVLFADLDCIYEPQWLASMVGAFEDPEIEVLAGETSTNITGAYSMALSMTCCFPRYSGETEIGTAPYYEFNNVAMRRKLLDRVPIPEDLPTQRGCGFLHAVALERAGVPIWRHPHARALHPIAGGLAHFTEHFLARGLDSACIARRLEDPSGKSYRKSSRLAKAVDRARQSLQEDPRRWPLLPLAIPIAAVSAAVYGAARLYGRLVTARGAAPLEAEAPVQADGLLGAHRRRR